MRNVDISRILNSGMITLQELLFPPLAKQFLMIISQNDGPALKKY